MQPLRELTVIEIENAKKLLDYDLCKQINLTHLTINNTNISDMESLRFLTNVCYLNMQGNRISSICPLENLLNLNELNLQHNLLWNLEEL